MTRESQIRRIEKVDMPPAVVVGTGITGLTLARAVGKHKVPVIGVDHKKRRYTSYSGAFHLMLVDRHDFWGPGLVSFLVHLAESLPRKAALLLSMDEHVKLVSAHGQTLKDCYHFEFPDRETVDCLMNKEAFNRLALERGWRVPRTYAFQSSEELAGFVSELSFPVILKPQIKNLSFRTNSPQKAFRCSSHDELFLRYDLIAQWEPEAIVQEWIPGRDDAVYFSFHYFGSNLREICSFQGRKIRQYRPECGSTASAVGVRDGDLARAAREILTTTRCVGFCSVEYKRNARSDIYYVTEPTVGRVNLQVGVAVANGVDIVSRGYFHMIGQQYPLHVEPTYERKWIILKSDVKSAHYYVKKSQYTWLDYLRSLRGPKTFAVWRLSDYKMMLGFCGIWLSAPFRLAKRQARNVLSKL